MVIHFNQNGSLSRGLSLKPAECRLRTVDWRLRIADCGLRTADCRLQTAAKMQTADYRLFEHIVLLPLFSVNCKRDGRLLNDVVLNYVPRYVWAAEQFSVMYCMQCN